MSPVLTRIATRARLALDFHTPGGRLRLLTLIAGVWWLLAWLDQSAWRFLGAWFQHAGFALGTVTAVVWWRRSRAWPVVARRALQTGVLPVFLHLLWHVLQLMGWSGIASVAAKAGLLTLFLTGLCWLVWWLEGRAKGEEGTSGRVRSWDPRRLSARYYRRTHRRLDQSMLAFVSYTLAFFLLGAMLTRLSGCREIYEMPAGGGELRLQQTVKVERVVERKYVVNPLSAVLFNPPPIDDVPLKLQELTEHLYQIGQGAGDNAGFASGSARGEVRFIRLEYGGGNWNQDPGSNADFNMLMEYGIRTGHKVADQPETRPVARLANFPPRQSPPFVYMTGKRGIDMSEREIEILRDYLLENHGMLFADNGGSQGWHSGFFSLMNRVLPRIRAVKVPLDHPIHRFPYQLPFLPYVAPHGGRDAWGWVVDGRLVAYYHPGDIGDAWADEHAGVPRHIYEYCYQLGTNVILYAHARYHRWLDDTSETSDN